MAKKTVDTPKENEPLWYQGDAIDGYAVRGKFFNIKVDTRLSLPRFVEAAKGLSNSRNLLASAEVNGNPVRLNVRNTPIPLQRFDKWFQRNAGKTTAVTLYADSAFVVWRLMFTDGPTLRLSSNRFNESEFVSLYTTFGGDMNHMDEAAEFIASADVPAGSILNLGRSLA